jgi:hypothetical protein
MRIDGMSDILVKVVKLLTGVFHGRPESRRLSVLGDDYERREARRSAIWVFAILVVLFLVGWWAWRKLTP